MGRSLRVSPATAQPSNLTVATRQAGRRTDLLGVAFILLTSLQFGSVVVIGKIATRPGGLPVPSLLAYRFAVAALLLAAALVAFRLPLAPARGEGWRLAALGMIGYAAEAGLFFASLRHGTAAAVTLLFFTYPVLVALLALASGKGMPGWLLGGALVSVVAGASIVAVAGGGVNVDGVGAALALGSALTISFYLVGAESVLKDTHSLTGSAVVSGSAAIGLAAFALATGNVAWPTGWHQWGPVLGMAVFTAGAFVCLFAGLRRLGVVRTSILSATEPLTATALAAIFLSEGVRPATALGGLLILAGAVVAAMARRQPATEAPVP